MRSLGAARTSALFSTAPLAGVILSFLLLREIPDALFILAIPLMVLGAISLVSEDHRHAHLHETITHEHSHRHDDEHHVHGHALQGRPIESHSHWHAHARVEHEHHHLPDTHHRHVHQNEL
jgi:hypothetical protein